MSLIPPTISITNCTDGLKVNVDVSNQISISPQSIELSCDNNMFTALVAETPKDITNIAYLNVLEELFINGISFDDYITTISPTFTGNTSGSCISELYVHNLGGCSPINVTTDMIVNGTSNSVELAPSISASTWTADTAKGWSISGDHIIKVADGQYSNKGAYPTIPISHTVGKLYKITFTINSITASSYAAFIVAFGANSSFLGTTTGTKTYYFRSLGSSGHLYFCNRSPEAATAAINISDISVKEIIEGKLKVENDLEVNGTLRIHNYGGRYDYPSLDFYKQGDPNYFKMLSSEEGMTYYIGASAILSMSTSGFQMAGTTPFGWASDVYLQKDAANILALKRYNSMTSPQEFRIYNTYSNITTDYERLSIKAVTGGAYIIGSEAAGTGVVRNISLMGGNVGIGTTSPSQKLDVNGKINASSTIYGNSGLSVLSTALIGGGYAGVVQIGNLSINAAAQLALLSKNTEAIRINASQNVGIGTTTPYAKLDVNGNVIISGKTQITSSVQIGDDTTGASSINAGAIRYRSDSNNSYCEMVMQTGSTEYGWVIIKQNTW